MKHSMICGTKLTWEPPGNAGHSFWAPTFEARFSHQQEQDYLPDFAIGWGRSACRTAPRPHRSNECSGDVLSEPRDSYRANGASA